MLITLLLRLWEVETGLFLELINNPWWKENFENSKFFKYILGCFLADGAKVVFFLHTAGVAGSSGLIENFVTLNATGPWACQASEEGMNAEGRGPFFLGSTAETTNDRCGLWAARVLFIVSSCQSLDDRISETEYLVYEWIIILW